MTNRITETKVAALRADLVGEVILPGDESYDSERKIWNGDFDRHPAMIVCAACNDDVLRGLAFARDHGLELTVRGCGHSFSGLSVANAALMIDLRRMNRVSVDPKTRRARVQGGANWAQVDREAQAHGLAMTAGQVSHTGVGGLTLGGGLGYLMRAFGLTIDHLISAEVVTADGRVVRASEVENEDLFFGLRGGGGNFGIVTEFEFKLNPLNPIVLGGEMGWSREHGPAFFHAYAELLKQCPDELMTTLIYLDLPPFPFVPPALRGKPGWIVSVCGIDKDVAEAALQPLRACHPAFDVVKPMPYLAIQSVLDEVEPYGTKLYGKSHFFNELSEELLLILHDQFIDLPTHETKVFALQMGGAVQRVSDEAMAFTGRNATMAIMFGAEWKEDSQKEQCINWVRRVWRATEKFAQGTYNNFGRHLDENTLKAIYGADKYRKLQGIKAKYDPTNMFHRNHNIQPVGDAVLVEPSKEARSKPRMDVAHIVVGAYDMEESRAFYQDILGFTDQGESECIPGGRTLACKGLQGQECFRVDLVETDVHWRLPDPYHFAIETDADSFESIYATLKARGEKVLSDPPPEPDSGGYGEWAVRGVRYRRYLFVDPTLVYHEILHRYADDSDVDLPRRSRGLRVNHLVIGASDVDQSSDFYTQIFGFKDLGENLHAMGARTLVRYSTDGEETLEVVIRPFDEWRLPNPTHFSLKVDDTTFEQILAAAYAQQLHVYAERDPASTSTGYKEFESCGSVFRRFFIDDPSSSRIEVFESRVGASSEPEKSLAGS